MCDFSEDSEIITAEKLRKRSAAADDREIQNRLHDVIIGMIDAADAGDRTLQVPFSWLFWRGIEWLVQKGFKITFSNSHGEIWRNISKMSPIEARELWFCGDIEYCIIEW